MVFRHLNTDIQIYFENLFSIFKSIKNVWGSMFQFFGTAWLINEIDDVCYYDIDVAGIVEFDKSSTNGLKFLLIKLKLQCEKEFKFLNQKSRACFKP